MPHPRPHHVHTEAVESQEDAKEAAELSGEAAPSVLEATASDAGVAEEEGDFLAAAASVALASTAYASDLAEEEAAAALPCSSCNCRRAQPAKSIPDMHETAAAAVTAATATASGEAPGVGMLAEEL